MPYARSDPLRDNILQRENRIPQHPNLLSRGQPGVFLIRERCAKVPRVEQPFLFTSLFFRGPIMVALRCRCAAGVLCLEKGKILLPPPLVLFYHSSFGNCSTQCYCKRLVRKYDYKVGFPKCPWKIFKWMRIPPESWKTLHLFTPCELLSSPTPIIAKQNVSASQRAWEVELHLLRFLPSLFF